MLLMFPWEFKRGVCISVCMGWSAIAQGQVHHFSAEALALFKQEAKREPLILPVRLSQPPVGVGGSLSGGTQYYAKPSDKTKSKLTTEQLNNSLNTLACIYVLIRLAYTYHAHFIVEARPAKWYDHLIPMRNGALVKKIRFAIASTLILGETLLGKSLAKLLILCVTGDIVDLVDLALVRLKKMIVG